MLINKIKELKKKYLDIYVCGTSIFRVMPDEQRKEFLSHFKAETNIDFIVITPEKENEYTVLGATKNTKGRVAVYVGGGGSTEIAIYDEKIKEMVNTPIGGFDILHRFPDLIDDLVTKSLEEVKAYIKIKIKKGVSNLY